jgi:hypothetical protein
MPHNQQRYHASSNHRNTSDVYYDPVTRCYYYNQVVPTTTAYPHPYYPYGKHRDHHHYPNHHDTYYQQHYSQPDNLYVYTTEYIEVEEAPDRPSGVIITEIDDDEDGDLN